MNGDKFHISVALKALRERHRRALAVEHTPKTTTAGKKPTVIHVNRSHIAINAKLGEPVLPVYTVKKGGKNTYGYSVEILGPSTLIDPRICDPLSCGARAYVTTTAEVRISDPMSFAEVKKMRSKL